jgi:hypothetical protein
MSFILAYQQALPKHAIARSITAYSRANSTTPVPPVQIRDSEEKQSTEIMTPPEREVMIADAISGAPGKNHSITHDTNLRLMLVWGTGQPSCIIGLYVFISPHGIPCRVVALRANVGELIGISCKERVGGRIL